MTAAPSLSAAADLPPALWVLMVDLNTALEQEGIPEARAVWEAHTSTLGAAIRLRLDGEHCWLDVGWRGGYFVRTPGTSQARRWKLPETAVDRLLRETVRLVRERDRAAREQARAAELADVVARVPGVRRNRPGGAEFTAPGQCRLRVCHDRISVEARGLGFWDEVPIAENAFDLEVESAVAEVVAAMEAHQAARAAARDRLLGVCQGRVATK